MMRYTLICSLVGLLLFLPPPLQAQALHRLPSAVTASIDPAFSSLPRLSRALRLTKTARILAIGSSSTAGIGASSPSRTYVARLETTLEAALEATDFEVVGHGLSGEAAQGAADRMKREVEETKPDLVIWQVGTNDALRHVALDGFTRCLEKTLAWLKEQQIDVILINPQYGDRLVTDPYYEQVVAAIAAIARERQVPLVDRFATMRTLQREHGRYFALSGDDLHMNDEGYRRLAERVAATIIKSLRKDDGAAIATAPGRSSR
jgi:acyl-CoA thioesterase I